MGSGDQIKKIFQLFLDDLEHIPDLKYVLDLESVPDFKRSFQIFPFRSFTNRFVPTFLRTRSMHLFLIVPFVLLKERSFPRNEAQPYLYLYILYVQETVSRRRKCRL